MCYFIVSFSHSAFLFLVPQTLQGMRRGTKRPRTGKSNFRRPTKGQVKYRVGSSYYKINRKAFVGCQLSACRQSELHGARCGSLCGEVTNGIMGYGHMGTAHPPREQTDTTEIITFLKLRGWALTMLTDHLRMEFRNKRGKA